jgi:hypothetical protein
MIGLQLHYVLMLGVDEDGRFTVCVMLGVDEDGIFTVCFM